MDKLFISLSDQCSLKCRHCFNDGGKITGRRLSESEIQDIILEARETWEIKQVQLTGGETSLATGIFFLLDRLIGSGLIVDFQTNGILPSNFLERLQGYSHQQLQFIISLDGFETNDYYRGNEATGQTINTVQYLSSRGFRVRINTLLTSRLSWEEAIKLRDLALEYNLALAFNPLCPTGRAGKRDMMDQEIYFDWMIKLEQLRGAGCQVRKNFDLVRGVLKETSICHVRKRATFHVAANGSCYPCGFFVNQDNFLVGRIGEDDLASLPGKVPESCSQIPDECAECAYYETKQCGAGCPVRIYAFYGTTNCADPYCLKRYYAGKGTKSGMPV